LTATSPAPVSGCDGWSRSAQARGSIDGKASKLTQKSVVAPPDFSRMTITNIYLSAEEFDLLAQLPAHELRKRRYRVEHDNRTFSVDAFEHTSQP
jgi:CYTH domain-containing protein